MLVRKKGIEVLILRGVGLLVFLHYTYLASIGLDVPIGFPIRV